MLAFRPTPLEFLTIFENVHIIGHGVGTKFQGIKQCVKFTIKIPIAAFTQKQLIIVLKTSVGTFFVSLVVSTVHLA